jgi:TetR/AcrR family transcriptional regulator, transcriptional repressor for nem operon
MSSTLQHPAIPRPTTARGRRTCAAIVSAAAELIYARGVAATSLDQVLERSGAGKSQLYHYFPAGKRDLVAAVVERQIESVLASQPRLSTIETWADLEAWADDVAARHRAPGGPFRCPLGSIAAELDRDPELRPVIASAFERWLAPLREAAARLQRRGELDLGADPGRVAERILGALQGAIVLARALEDPAAVQRALGAVLAQLSAAGGRLELER